jgi:hypothetical protein
MIYLYSKKQDGGGKMDRLEIKEKLQDLYDLIDRIMKTYKEKPSGYKERIKAEYAQLKKDLRTERGRIDTVRWRNQASSDEKNFYFHAIIQACIELRVKSGSLPNDVMYGNLYAACMDISFSLDGLKKQKV